MEVIGAAQVAQGSFVAGPNGAGKTTVTERGLLHQWFGGCEYVNPDLIAQQELGDWNDPAAVLQAARIATERREACLREGRSLAFETVFSGRVVRRYHSPRAWMEPIVAGLSPGEG
jgi:predicted ABC-type ATPase